VTANVDDRSRVTANRVTGSRLTGSRLTASRVTANRVTGSRVTGSDVTGGRANGGHPGGQRLDDLRNMTAELERRLVEARASYDRELSRVSRAGSVSRDRVSGVRGLRDHLSRDPAPPDRAASNPLPHGHANHQTLGFPDYEPSLDEQPDLLSADYPAPATRLDAPHAASVLFDEPGYDLAYEEPFHSGPWIEEADFGEPAYDEPVYLEPGYLELPDQEVEQGDADAFADLICPGDLDSPGDLDTRGEPGRPQDVQSSGEHGSPDETDFSGEDASPGDHDPAGVTDRSDPRTEELLAHGRRTARLRPLPRSLKVTAAGVIAAALGAIAVLVGSGCGASWPVSAATVQREAARACRNANVQSEPGQVNFACAKNTRQILWIFALLTSHDNPNFVDRATGRVGLEPITPTQGGEVAWSLNLHHPYDPANPVDSLEVAARAINNIIGGATLTGAHGDPVVQPGLESKRANCVRYTGSPARTARTGYPRLCARPMTGPGKAALVADVFRKWMVGAGRQAAQDAAVLFQNANNPGNPRVQAVLRHLRNP
jgi:hypothetical protein